MSWSDTPIIKKLNSREPQSEYRDKLMLFGQFVGDWDIVEDRNLLDDGTWTADSGELHWGWILEGKALQDVWMVADSHVWDIGTTIRFYDPHIDAWHSTWISPSRGIVTHFIGRQVGEEIVLEATDMNNMLIHWIFYDISENFFKWRAERSSDSGLTWLRTEEMVIRRHI